MNQSGICVFGSLNIDLTVRLARFHVPGETVTGRSFHTFTGGKGGNQAVAAARLGARTAMIACLGADANGDMYLRALEREGVDTGHVARVTEETSGVALIEVDDAGENRIAVVPGANACLTAARAQAVLRQSGAVAVIRKSSRYAEPLLKRPCNLREGPVRHIAAVLHDASLRARL